MPIYKISRRGKADERARSAFVRTRFLALLVSASLLITTILLILHKAHFS